MRNRFHPDNPDACTMPQAITVLAAVAGLSVLAAAGVVVLVLAVINGQDDPTELEEQDQTCMSDQEEGR